MGAIWDPLAILQAPEVGLRYTNSERRVGTGCCTAYVLDAQLAQGVFVCLFEFRLDGPARGRRVVHFLEIEIACLPAISREQSTKTTEQCAGGNGSGSSRGIVTPSSRGRETDLMIPSQPRKIEVMPKVPAGPVGWMMGLALAVRTVQCSSAR